MVQLTEFIGENPLRTSIEKKRAKAQESLDKLMAKAKPLQNETAMYDKMLAALDEHYSIPVEVSHVALVDECNADPGTFIGDAVSTQTRNDDEEEKPAFLRNHKVDS